MAERPLPSSDVEANEQPIFGFYEGFCFICNKKTTDGGLYCSEACRDADSLTYSPAYPPSASSSVHTSNQRIGHSAQEDLFFQDIPELDIGGSLAYSSSAVRKRKSRSSAGKSLSSTNASSQSSSPISAPSTVDDADSSLVDPLMLSKGVRSSPKHTSNTTSQAALALEVNISPALRPMLRYSRRAYSTNVRGAGGVAHVSNSAGHHIRTPSGYLLDNPHPPPESTPISSTNSPILPPKPSPSLGESSSSARHKKISNRRSLPLTLAPLTVTVPDLDYRQTRDLFTGPLTSLGLIPPRPPYASSSQSSSGQGTFGQVIAPSHILGGHASDWKPQPYQPSHPHPNRPTPNYHKHSSSSSSSHHTTLREYPQTTSETERTETENGSSSSNGGLAPGGPDVRERVTSTGTIKRPTHMKQTSHSRLGSIMRGEPFGLGVGRATPTPPILASVSVSASASASSMASTFSELALNYPQHQALEEEIEHRPPMSPMSPSQPSTSNSTAQPPFGSIENGTFRRSFVGGAGGRGRSPRRSSAVDDDRRPLRQSSKVVYQPTFSSSSRSSPSPARSIESRPVAREIDREWSLEEKRRSSSRRRQKSTSARRGMTVVPSNVRHSRSPRRGRGTISELSTVQSSSPSHSSSPSSHASSSSLEDSDIENQPVAAAAPMRVRRQTDGHPERYLGRRRMESRSREREREKERDREGRGRSRDPAVLQGKTMALAHAAVEAEERPRGRSMLR